MDKTKSKLHPRNKNRQRYDFGTLIKACPELAPFVQLNPYGNESIDFSNPDAVKTLNKALLLRHYGIKFWDIPEGFLCPPIPGRADYIHYIADLLAEYNREKIPRVKNVIGLDIGTGANCIYPIIGNREYNWSFIGTDANSKAVQSANNIIAKNPGLKNRVEIRQQDNRKNIFIGILKKDETIDFTLCNPPFFSSSTEAYQATLRKTKNLKRKNIDKPDKNFSGQDHELWYQGGEIAFIQNMITESRQFPIACFWFTTLVSQKGNLKSIYDKLNEEKVSEIKTIEMSQGNKSSRIVAWTFLNKSQQIAWAKYRWNK